MCAAHGSERRSHGSKTARTDDTQRASHAAAGCRRASAIARRSPRYTESEYVATLVRGQTPIARPGAEMQDVALAGNRVVRAIGMLENGPDDRPEIVRLLREAQAAIAAELRRATSNYEQAIATQVADDTWGDA